MINENVSFESQFSLKVVNEDNIKILNLNSQKKTVAFGILPVIMLKISSDICNVALQNI